MKYLNSYITHINEGTRHKIEKFLDEAELDGKIKKIKVSDLTPAQNEIFLDEIISNLLQKKKFVKKSLKGKLKDDEIIVSSDNYIIDGHHKWASAFILNPNCKIKCTKINIELKEAIEILTDLLEEINAGNQRQSGDFKYNIFDLIKDDKDELRDTIIKIFKKKSGNEKKLLKRIDKRKKSDLNSLTYLINNIYKIPTPDHKKYDRKNMPQISDKEIEEILD
jgi:hypothetical protein